MGYTDYSSAITRIPITLIRITLDYCSRTFGSSPCTATGTKCYNTFVSCKDLAHFTRTTKEYKFSSAEAPLPFKEGERPFIKEVKYLPTEIKDSLTVSARVIVQMLDNEPDSDVGIDPYVADRASVQGSFWKKLLARNPNYKDRKIEIFEGFLGLAEEDFELRFSGLLYNIQIRKQGQVELECVDKLYKLKETETPQKLEISVNGAHSIDSDIIYIEGDGISSLESSGYVKIADNIISYTAKGTSYTAGSYISGCAWGEFDTGKTAIPDGEKVAPVKYFAPDHPFDHLDTLIKLAGYTDSDIDLDSFAAYDKDQEPLGDGTPNKNGWRDWPDDLINFSAVITEPTPTYTLIQEIAEIIDARLWVNEQGLITIRRNVPNKPSRSYHTLSDESGIIERSGELSIESDKRLTRITCYWGLFAGEDPEKPESFRFSDTVIDADAENQAGFGDTLPKKIFCRWISLDCAPTVYPYESEAQKIAYCTLYVKEYCTRIINRFREPPMKLKVQVELKDEGILTGDFVRVSTDYIQDKDGNPISAQSFQVVRRERIAPNKLSLLLNRMPTRRIDFIGPASQPDYTSATADEREWGFIGGDNELMSNDDPCYRIY